MAGRVITLANVDPIIHATFQRLVDRNRWAREAFRDGAEAFVARLQFEVRVGGGFGDGADDGDPVALGTDIVRG